MNHTTFPQKEEYTYDDIIALDLEGNIKRVTTTIGHKLIITNDEYPFIHNPYLVNEYDKFTEQYARNSTSTLNNQLLMETGKIIDI